MLLLYMSLGRKDRRAEEEGLGAGTPGSEGGGAGAQNHVSRGKMWLEPKLLDP